MAGSEVAPTYVLGHSDREQRRLQLQASILNPITEGFLKRAGITTGMRVLDVGCGVGDVSLLAARLVGHRGSVTGVDLDRGSLETARRRVQSEGLTQVSFTEGRIEEYRASDEFDAVIGRHILIHTPNPLGVLQSAFRILRRGGVVAFQEYDFSVGLPTYPACPLKDQLSDIYQEFFCRYINGDIGIRLFHLLGEAGFSARDCRAEFPIDGGADSLFYEWFAETFRTLAPKLEAVGLLKGLDANVDTLADRLREEAVARGASISAPLMIGGFARKA